MIAVTAAIRIRPEMAASFERAARELEEQVNALEEGCLVYRMTKSREDPDIYMNIELYRDQAALDLHQQTPYFQKALSLFAPCVGGEPKVEFFDTVF